MTGTIKARTHHGIIGTFRQCRPVGGGPEQQLSDSIYRFDYAVVEGGIYIIRDGALDYLDLRTGKSTTLVKIRRPDIGISVSPDGRYLLYAQVDALGSYLMLVERFR